MAGRGRLLAALALFVGGAAAMAQVTAASLAGRYSRSFRNGDVSGAAFTSTDEVVILPLDSRRAYVRMQLNFFNGHECGIGGVATIEGDALVYRDPAMTGYGEGGACELRIRRDGGRLAWSDGSSCGGYCGARGSLNGGSMAWSSRRPISRAERVRLLGEYERERNLP